MPELYRRHGTDLSLSDTTLVVALEGWIDAGLAAGATAAALANALPLQTIAVFDDEALIDYRARRPVLHLREGVSTGLQWASLTMVGGHDARGRGLLLLSGPEPDARWRGFVDAVLDLAVEHGTTTVCSLGAYPMPVPHTRPSRLALTSPDVELVERFALERGTVDLPAGVVSVLELEAHRRGLRAMGLWAQVPHYASSMPYPAASLALVDGLRTVAGLTVPGDSLELAARTTRTRIDELVGANPEHVALLRQLEEQYDAAAPSLGSGPLPSGDELAAELERFLREQRE